jgi:ClpP class serine protease
MDLFMARGPGNIIRALLHCPVMGKRAFVSNARRCDSGPVFAPHYAMSGGSLIALSASEIVMDINAVLGPIDPQLGDFPAASVLKVIKRKPMADVEDETLILADQAEKAIVQLRESVKELLDGKPTNGKGPDELARLLAEVTWTHDYPITYERAKALRLPVRSDISHDVLKLMSLYPQPTVSLGDVCNPRDLEPVSEQTV